MFRRFINYIKNRGLCFTSASPSNKVLLAICSDLDVARITTPYGDDLIDGIDNIVAGLTAAYKSAQGKGDDVVMAEIHSIKHEIMKQAA
jgi:hypothetical protein